jgi:cbb3-type cytochrome oxidase subunit 3
MGAFNSVNHSFTKSIITNMNGASVIFYAVFVLPLIAFLIWIIRQDKRKGKIGLIVLLITVVGVIAYMYVKKMFMLNGPVYTTPAMLTGFLMR